MSGSWESSYPAPLVAANTGRMRSRGEYRLDTTTPTFIDVTEVAGEPISQEQLERLAHRYMWAAQYCEGKDVAEIACGTGPGLGLLDSVARDFEAGDVSGAMIDIAQRHYGPRIKLSQFDAQKMPFEDSSKDVLVIFEALYYIPDIESFIDECRRVLRPGGRLLIATANKDLADFNPSPHSFRYLGASEMAGEFSALGSVELFGYLDTQDVSLRQRLLRPIKMAVVSLGLMPRTMAGKRVLKRLVFGRPVEMPAELTGTECAYVGPDPIGGDAPDRRHKVLYCAVTVGPM
jgi:SAM-dependent methyltransferase